MNPFFGKSLLSLKDYSQEEIRLLLDLSKKVKAQRRAGEVHQRLLGKTIALIFEKPSTRTRCSFETAIGEEGGYGVFLNPNDIQLGKKETVEDTARVLGRMFDAIQFRGFHQKTVQTLADYAGVPVYNGLTDLFHPTQILADLLTLEEEWGSLEGQGPLVYLGDGRNNMGNSLMIGCAIMNLPFTISSPKALQPEEELISLAKELGGQPGISAWNLTQKPRSKGREPSILMSGLVWARKTCSRNAKRSWEITRLIKTFWIRRATQIPSSFIAYRQSGETKSQQK
jgi:ornithine carbamoyltransferase